jgi:hypothetical protein
MRCEACKEKEARINDFLEIKGKTEKVELCRDCYVLPPEEIIRKVLNAPVTDKYSAEEYELATKIMKQVLFPDPIPDFLMTIIKRGINNTDNDDLDEETKQKVSKYFDGLLSKLCDSPITRAFVKPDFVRLDVFFHLCTIEDINKALKLFGETPRSEHIKTLKKYLLERKASADKN